MSVMSSAEAWPAADVQDAKTTQPVTLDRPYSVTIDLAQLTRRLRR